MRFPRFSIILLLVFFVSCSSDDGGAEPTIVGIWSATSFTTSLELDLNGDGVESTDIIEELDCYTSVLTISEDGRFNSSTSDFTVTQVADGFIGECDAATVVSGTYTYENGSFTTIANGQTIESTVEISATQMTIRSQDQVFGNLTVVYSRN